MKKSLFLLAGLLLLSSINIWAQDDDYICLDGKKDTILATSVRITSPEDGFAMALGDRIQVTTTKNPENALLDTVKLTCALSSMFSLTDDGWLIANPADLNANICNNTARVFARTVLSRKAAYINVKCYENYTYNGNVPEYVELAGEKWATRNVGANSPADMGKFFMWGNIGGYTVEEFVPGNPLYDAGGYTVENYNNTSLGLGEGATRASSYTPGDVKYDAATVANSHHVTPTQDQLLALANDTGVTWITIDGNYRRFERHEGLKGVVIIKNGTQISDGQFIFIPMSKGYNAAYSSFPVALTSIWTCTASGTLLSNSARHVSWMLSTSSVCSDGRTLERGDDGEDIMSYNTNRHLGKVIRPIYREYHPFSVSETKYVEFSTGNAQYNSTSRTWRFAPYQNSIIGNTTSEWTDLHLWNANFSSLGSEWRMLSNAEWTYLLNTRTNATALRSAATVSGVPGLIILPDTWEWPDKIDESKRWTTGSNNTSTYSFSNDWDKMENAGAIFLPIAGWIEYKGGKDTYKDTNKGYYWTSTQNGNDKAYYFYIESNKNNALNTKNDGKINEAKYSIRLVKDL